MESFGRNNFARLCGTLAGPPALSHETRRERFFRFPLRTQRLSGAYDTVNVLSRERLLAGVWGVDFAGETRTVDVHIGQLRKKLDLGDRIRTVSKLGYRLEDSAK